MTTEWIAYVLLVGALLTCAATATDGRGHPHTMGVGRGAPGHHDVQRVFTCSRR